MARYKVTTELKTPLWKKVLRWMRIYPKMETFELQTNYDIFKPTEVIKAGWQNKTVKIIKKL